MKNIKSIKFSLSIHNCQDLLILGKFIVNCLKAFYSETLTHIFPSTLLSWQS
jgi:hypothetical protein